MLMSHEYKGYRGEAEFDAQTRTYVGQISGIKDLVTFEAESKDSFENEFKDAVDDYLSFCKAVGKAPDIPEQEGKTDD